MTREISINLAASASALSSNEARLCSHLADGKYRAQIASLCTKYPNLRYPDPCAPKSVFVGKVVAIDLSSSDTPERKNFADPADFESYLEATRYRTSDESTTRRILLIEGSDPQYVGLLGSYFDIEPMLIVRQQRTASWESYHQSGNTPTLPSLLDPCRICHIPYYELHYRSQGLNDKTPWRCADSGRQVSWSRLPGTFDFVAIADRKASYWSQRRGEDGWDAVIFLDPPVRNIRPDVGFTESMNSLPYQGGYPDFIKFTTLQDACRTSGPSRKSMLEDICYYWTNHASCIDIQSDPAVSTIFLKKIIASNYMILIEHGRAMLSTIELSLSRQGQDISELQIAWAEQRWSDLQSWNRRYSEYCENVESIIDNMRISSPEEDASWLSSKLDFHVIHRKLCDHKRRSEALISSLTGLAGILGSRQTLKEANRSLHEAKRVKILTSLGMVFAPWFLTSGIFSMSDKFLPGAKLFWIYFAVTIPLVPVVFGVAFLVTLGYGDDSEWSSKEFWKAVRDHGSSAWEYCSSLIPN
ncbi:MAG: hypothetical protein Q9195_002826 [Heterodermia aff. obscurata]